mgnify:FL=1
MKRLLLDTNIYGDMLLDKDLFILKDKHKEKKENVCYGFSVIRKELRATSKEKSLGRKNLRIALLCLYDEFVGEHNLDVDDSKLTNTALKYYGIYRQLGGNLSKSELLNDFVIVACASHKEMDLVASNDDATMLSEISLKAYKLVNEILGLRNPQFIDYEDLKKLLLS